MIICFSQKTLKAIITYLRSQRRIVLCCQMCYYVVLQWAEKWDKLHLQKLNSINTWQSKTKVDFSTELALFTNERFNELILSPPDLTPCLGLAICLKTLYTLCNCSSAGWAFSQALVGVLTAEGVPSGWTWTADWFRHNFVWLRLYWAHACQHVPHFTWLKSLLHIYSKETKQWVLTLDKSLVKVKLPHCSGQSRLQPVLIYAYFKLSITSTFCLWFVFSNFLIF